MMPIASHAHSHCAALARIVRFSFSPIAYLRCVYCCYCYFSFGAKTKLTPITSQPLSKPQSRGEWQFKHADDAFVTHWWVLEYTVKGLNWGGFSYHFFFLPFTVRSAQCNPQPPRIRANEHIILEREMHGNPF